MGLYSMVKFCNCCPREIIPWLQRFLVNVNFIVCYTRNLVLLVECWVIEACGLAAEALRWRRPQCKSKGWSGVVNLIQKME